MDHKVGTTAAWLVTVSALALSTAAVAQEAAPATADNASQVEEIIVTAQRREQRLQDVPATISAFSGEQLERVGVTSSRELTQVTPGLNFTQSSYSPQPTIRGIGTRSVSAGDESVVPVYIDGVYQPFLVSTIFELSNIERIEVLRGPQGALYGRNATGGAINVITKAPSADPSAQFTIGYGSFNEVEAKAYLNGGTDILSVNLAALFRKDDGYIRDLVRGGDTGQSQNVGVRAKVRFEPSEFMDFTLALGHAHGIDAAPFATQPLDGNTVARRFNPAVLIPTGPYETSGTSNALKTIQESGSLTAAFHFDSFDVTSITSGIFNRLKAYADNDATPYEAGWQSYSNYSRAMVQELYATSAGDGPFQWTAGLTYYHDVSGHKPVVSASRSVTTGVLGRTAFTSSVVTDSIAFYGQGSFEFGNGWEVTVAGRYTSEDKAFSITRNGVHYEDSDSWTQFTPSATLKYTFSPRFNVYARAGQAFKAGVYAASTFGAKAVDPEVVTQYELGLKADPTSWLRLNLSTYFTDYQDMQVNARDPVTNTSFLQNAGGAEIYGVEGEAFVSPMAGLNLRAGVSWLHGEYVDFEGAQVNAPTGLGGNGTSFIDASGNKIIRTPFITANLGADYTFDVADGEMTIAGNIFHSGKSYWEVGNRVVEDPYTLVNGELSWRAPDGGYKIALWGDNLFDEERRLFVLSSASGDTQVYARPRTIGVRLTLDLP